MTDTPQPVTPPTPPPWRRRAIILLLAALILIPLLIYYYWQPLTICGERCTRFLSNKQQLKVWLQSFGPLAPVVFIAVQSLQVVFAPIPGEVTGFLGGFLFGVVPGFIYSTVGLTLGSILAFLLGRWLEIHFVEKVVSRQTLDKFDFLMERQGALIAFLLFLFPGFPKDYLCFILGLSPMPFRLFVILVTIGRLPGTLMLSLQGAHVFKGNYYSFLALMALFVILAILTVLYREKLYQWMRRFADGTPPSGGST